MSQLKNYTGSVYGGLGHLLKAYCETKNIEIPEQLQQVQNLERFDYVIWRDLLEDLNRLNPKTGLGLEIAEHVQPKHLGIIAYLALSCENLGEALARYHDFHRLIYDGSPLVVEFNPPYASIRWEAPEPNPTQLTDEIAIAIVHKAVGQISESDVLLATASDAIIVGFNVRPSNQANKLAMNEGVQIKSYSIIYNAIEEIKSAMEGLLEPKVEEKEVATVEIREVFKFDKATVAGCYVTDGKVKRDSKIRLFRDGILIYPRTEGAYAELGSLKRFKDDAKEVATGYECGLTMKNFSDIQVGDTLVAYEQEEVKRTL